MADTLYGWYVDNTLCEQSLTLGSKVDIMEQSEFDGTKPASMEPTFAIGDIFESAYSQYLSTFHHFSGSRAEGVNTATSDLDSLREIKHVIASEDVRSFEIKANTEETVFYVHTDGVSPGYCMLEIIKEGLHCNEISICFHLPCFHMLGALRLFSSFLFKFVHFTLKARFLESKENRRLFRGVGVPKTGWNGPALNDEYSLIKFDTAYAIRMITWPKQSLQWLTRERKYGWPNSDILESAKEKPVFVVPCGSKAGPNEDIEWTFAFNLIEILLVHGFNSTQRRSYKLLKLLINTNITPLFGKDVISSYCLKTLMFWCIEDSPQDIWQPKNLMSCIQLCLRNLLLMLNMEGGPLCPHYFIPDKNLFYGKVGLLESRTLIPELDKILLQTFQFLVRIPELAVIPAFAILPWINVTFVRAFCLANTQNSFLSFTLLHLLQNIEHQEKPKFETVVEKHQSVLCTLQEIREKGNCTEVLNDIITTVLGSLGLHCISLHHSSKTETRSQNDLYKFGEQYLFQGCELSVGASLIKLGSFYLLEGNLSTTLELMDTVLEGDIQVISLMVTLDKMGLHFVSESVKKQISNFTNHAVKPNTFIDVIYLPGEIYAVQKAIQVEMFKILRQDSQSFKLPIPLKNFVAVDPIVNAIFLQFLCYKHRGDRRGMLRSLRKLELLCTSTINKYRTSSMNLLGYCYLKTGFKNRGIQMFLRSISLEKENPAYWHLALFAWKEILDEWNQT